MTSLIKELRGTMKIVFIILTIFLATACETTVSTKTQTKDCKLNGEKVDCRYFEKAEAPKTMQLNARISAAAEITDTQIEILENAQDIAEKDGNECSLEVHAGLIIGIKKVGRLLMVTSNDQSATYVPTEITNEWQYVNYDKQSKVMTTTKIKLEEKKFISEISCLFI
jgi:hypothetical protein